MVAVAVVGRGRVATRKDGRNGRRGTRRRARVIRQRSYRRKGKGPQPHHHPVQYPLLDAPHPPPCCLWPSSYLFSFADDGRWISARPRNRATSAATPTPDLYWAPPRVRSPTCCSSPTSRPSRSSSPPAADGRVPGGRALESSHHGRLGPGAPASRQQREAWYKLKCPPTAGASGAHLSSPPRAPLLARVARSHRFSAVFPPAATRALAGRDTLGVIELFGGIQSRREPRSASGPRRACRRAPSR